MATSHAWNLGPAATCGSGAMAAWNRGQWALGCQRLARGDDGSFVWSYTCKAVSGQRQCTFVQGLANRRADEAQTCNGAL
jgi:GH24 family phage-related lysozyme (muramidase)